MWVTCVVVLFSHCLLCFAGWFSHSSWDPDQNIGDNGTNCSLEVDFFKTLNVSTALRGVRLAHGPKPLEELPAWKFQSTFDHVQLPPEPTTQFLRAVQKSQNLTMYFVYRQHRKTIATLLAVNSPGKLSPWLRLTSNLKHSHLTLFYHIREDHRLHEKLFPLPRPMNWTLLEISIHGDVITLYLACQKARAQKLAGHINLHFPPDSLVYFRQEPGFKKKLVGIVQVARVSACSSQERLWQCGNTTMSSTNNLP